jgi:predicted NUDIX family phosphoesterase
MEQVFVVERHDFFSSRWPHGFVAMEGADARALLERLFERGFFVDRAEAEREPRWKQLIPYCVIRRPQAVFCVQRKSAQTETRLHHRLSIGIGGHINPRPERIPTSGRAFFAAALRQELDEELSGLGPPLTEPVFLGLLNDDQEDVGRVHAGLVYGLDCPAPAPSVPLPRVRELSKMAGGFRSLADLRPLWQDPGRFESWSRILFQAGVAGILASRSPHRLPPPPGAAERNTHG